MGLLPGTNDYQETDPVTGEITFTVPPDNGAKLFVECSTRTGSTVSTAIPPGTSITTGGTSLTSGGVPVVV
jgi:hypothetical protein